MKQDLARQQPDHPTMYAAVTVAAERYEIILRIVAAT